MTEDTTTDDGASAGWQSMLGLGGATALCCLFATPAATGAVGTTVAGGTTAALGGGIIRVLVSAVTVGVLAVLVGRRTDCKSCAE